MDKIIGRYNPPLTTEQLKEVFAEVIDFKEQEKMTDELIADFEDWVWNITHWGDNGLEQTGDALWPLYANLGIAYIINTGSVPVTETVWDQAKEQLRDYEHILDGVIDTLIENGWLGINDDLELTFTIPRCSEGCDCRD